MSEERAIKYYQWLDEHQDFKTGTPEQQAKYKSFLEAYKVARENMTLVLIKLLLQEKKNLLIFLQKKWLKIFYQVCIEKVKILLML